MSRHALLAAAVIAALALPARAQRPAEPISDDAFARGAGARPAEVPPVGGYSEVPAPAASPGLAAAEKRGEAAPAAPEIDAEDIAGRRVKLSTLKGKVVLLDFFAVWCPPCKRSTPFLIGLSRKYAGDGLVVVGIEKGSSKADVEAYAKKAGIPYSVLADPDLNIFGAYGVEPVPTFILVDRKGKAVWGRAGFGDSMAADFEAKIVEVLKAK